MISYSYYVFTEYIYPCDVLWLHYVEFVYQNDILMQNWAEIIYINLPRKSSQFFANIPDRRSLLRY